MTIITSLTDLEALYQPAPNLASTAKERDHLIPAYRQLIEASPFMALATCGPEGLDCSPRGDDGAAVRILDDRTLALADRRGNNRIDSLRNIVRDPRVALLFLIPGSGTTMRVNGRAAISVETALLERFAVDGKMPRCVVLITIEKVYFQCARAVVRARLWEGTGHRDPASLPTPGQILQETSAGSIDATTFDTEWPGRAAKTLW